MTEQTFISFNDGHKVPQLGLGVWQTPNDTVPGVVKTAIETGYRHIDTAAIYNNEEGVGRGIREAGIDRAELFITTKLWNSEQGYDSTLRAFDDSAKRLGLAYLDLYLIHWANPRAGKYVDSWKAMIRLRDEGRIRSIGVSNFAEEHLDRVISETGVTPALNQIELHPDFQQRDMRAADFKRGIATESWSPLGQGGALLKNPAITKIAAKHGKTPAQIVIRWHLQNDLVVIPKSANPQRIAENFNVFGFTLDDEDLSAIGKLDSPKGRIGPDPREANF